MGIVLCYFVTRMLLSFGRMFYELNRRARYFYEAQKALLLFAKRLARWMRDKVVNVSDKVARRRRKFFRISATEIHFVKESKHENSPPQAENFKDLRC